MAHRKQESKQKRRVMPRCIANWREAVDKLAQDNNGTLVVLNPNRDSVRIEGLNIIRQLGRGSMGTIYEAENAHDNKRVAVKVLSPELCGDPDLERRFQREFSVLQALRHPGLVRVLSSGKSNGALYFVMELLEGTALRSLIPSNAQSLVPIFQSLGESLDAAHDYGVVHGDIKPENIFVRQSASGTVVGTTLIDFGLSKVVGLDRLTATGEAVGTPAYMAPEIITGGELDGRTDVYALAIVAYESLSGQPPFQERNPAKLMFEIVSGTPVPLGERLPHASAELGRVLARGFARDPAARPTSAGAFVRDFLQAIGKQDDALA